MATTSNYQWVTPELGDRPNVPQYLKSLANQIDASLKSQDTILKAQIATALSLSASPTCRVRRVTSQTIASQAEPMTGIAFTSEDFDADRWHSTSSYPTRITPDVAGLYLVATTIEFMPNGVGARSVRIGVNGLTIPQGLSQVTSQAVTTGVPTNVSTSAVVVLNGTTDFIEIGVSQTSGGDLITGEYNGCWCTVTRIGA